MFLKTNYNFINIGIFLIVFIALISLSAKSNEDVYFEKITNFFDELNEFSSTFLQIQNNDISEGLLFIKDDRLRIEYTSPINLVFVLKRNKGMYFNLDLQEVQYFNPKDTAGQFLLDIFNNNSFFNDTKISKGSGFFSLIKEIQVNDQLNRIEVYFEEKPFQLRKLHIINDQGVTSFTINNHNFNPDLNEKIFSLANPLLG